MAHRDIVAEFKKSRERDQVRRDLLMQFQQSDRIQDFKEKIKEEIMQLLLKDEMVRCAVTVGSSRDANKMLFDELQRFPTLERAVADHPMFSDEMLLGKIRDYIERSLEEKDGKE
ncbi:hypothetical protein V5O48_001843 [Marasmius crinis-equi]|uniref:Uncharacterized protein n=1 Tax=Marasmius crinis-equi TaxID=585013 RepID=A0ABR3FXB5_9AGAR